MYSKTVTTIDADNRSFPRLSPPMKGTRYRSLTKNRIFFIVFGTIRKRRRLRLGIEQRQTTGTELGGRRFGQCQCADHRADRPARLVRILRAHSHRIRNQ